MTLATDQTGGGLHTHTLTNNSKISIHNHQDSSYMTTYISAGCPTQSTPNALWAQGILFTTNQS